MSLRQICFHNLLQEALRILRSELENIDKN